MTTVNLANGTVLNFPDETPPDVIQRAIDRFSGQPSAGQPVPAPDVAPGAVPFPAPIPAAVPLRITRTSCA